MHSRSRTSAVDHKRVLRFLVMLAITSTLAVIGLSASTASADELSSKDLIDRMRANDAPFESAIIKLQYTDLSTAPPTKSKLNVRLPNGRFAKDVQSDQQKKPAEFEYLTRHDDSIDAKDLPDPKKLFTLVQCMLPKFGKESYPPLPIN